MRRITVHPKEVLLVRAHLEAREGLANLFAEQGGDLTLATTSEQLHKLDCFLKDLHDEMPIWGPDAPRAH
ncbi:MAG: hypothetical protein RMJ98_16565 [Myxococcales bacterium]|nr:hypothetical protein [Myxococcales bacterium]